MTRRRLFGLHTIQVPPLLTTHDSVTAMNEYPVPLNTEEVCAKSSKMRLLPPGASRFRDLLHHLPTTVAPARDGAAGDVVLPFRPPASMSA
jgi:hypothetical protein